MFHELRDGVVRVDPDLAASLAEDLMPKLARQASRLANEFVKRLRRVHIPYRLVRIGRNIPTDKAEFTDCAYCKQRLPRKGLKFCGRPCYLQYSVEVRQPLTKAQGKLNEMRLAGLSPGHGGRPRRSGRQRSPKAIAGGPSG